MSEREDRKEQARAVAGQARELQLQGDWAEAEKAYLAAFAQLRLARVASGEQFAKLSFNLGSLYFAQRRYTDARRQVRAAMKSCNNPEAHYWLAECYFKEGRYKSADKAYSALLARNDLSPEQSIQVLKSAGFFYYFIGDFARSEPLLKQCLELVPPESAEAAFLHERLALLYQFVDEPPSERAGTSFQRMLAHSDTWGSEYPCELAGGLTRMACWQAESGQHQNAESSFKRMMGLIKDQAASPEIGWMKNHYADFLTQTGRPEEAKRVRGRAPSFLTLIQGTGPAQGVHESASSSQAVEWLMSQGAIAQFENNIVEAERLYRLALSKQESLGGLHDPGLCRILCSLARIQKDGESLVKRALAISEANLDREEERATVLECAAQFLIDGPDASIRSYEQALALKEKVHGPRSSKALECRWRLGKFLYHQEQVPKSAEILATLCEWSKVNRKIHPLERADFLNSYARALRQLGQTDQAAAIESEAGIAIKRHSR